MAFACRSERQECCAVLFIIHSLSAAIYFQATTLGAA